MRKDMETLGQFDLYVRASLDLGADPQVRFKPPRQFRRLLDATNCRKPRYWNRSRSGRSSKCSCAMQKVPWKPVSMTHGSQTIPGSSSDRPRR